MSWEAWYTVGTISLVIITLMSGRIGVDTAMVGGLALLLLGDAIGQGGILSVDDGIQGFAHPAIIMIGSLFVVAAGLKETGGLEVVAQRLLGRPKTIAAAQLRMMVPVALLSGFMNNTPIVAMYLPIINDWAKKLRISPSKLYMPLSFGAILGGKISLIGTASNIVVIGMYMVFFDKQVEREKGLAAAGETTLWFGDLGLDALSSSEQFWGIAWLGVPTTILGITLIVLTARWLLPERKPADPANLDSRRYQVEMMVEKDSPIVGKSIEAAGLRHLPGLYLTQIERGENILPAVSPDEPIQANDRLAFAGVLDSVVDLRKIRGLVPATDQVHKLAADRRVRSLVEAVVARNSPLVGQTVREVQFRTRYNAAIIAVHRRGELIEAKVGNITLQAGDTLLLETHIGFVDAYRNSDDFHLVSQVGDWRPIRHDRAGLALGILAFLVLLLTVTNIHPVVGALACAGLMVATRCVSGTVARNSINWQVLLVIGSALGMGSAMTETGAAQHIADSILALSEGAGPHALLFTCFVLAAAMAQLITNNGAAVLMFPICMGAAESLHINPEPFVFTLMVAAGSTFLLPVSYQTNLMVYGPGGYRFHDFARLGLPLMILLGLICTFVAPLAFPFQAGP